LFNYTLRERVPIKESGPYSLYMTNLDSSPHRIYVESLPLPNDWNVTDAYSSAFFHSVFNRSQPLPDSLMAMIATVSSAGISAGATIYVAKRPQKNDG
jgi:hypothetical protein